MKPLRLYLIFSAGLVILGLSTSLVATGQSPPSLEPSGTFTAPKAPQPQNNNNNQSSSPTPTPTPTATTAATRTVETSPSSSPSVTESTTGSCGLG